MAPFKQPGEGIVYDKAYIWLVYVHAIARSGNKYLHLISVPGMLYLCI